MTTKAHHLVDGQCRPLAIAVTTGQAGDNPALAPLLAELRVPRRGPGRPRTTPDALRADKADSARATRALLRARGIETVIPEPADQARHRKNRVSHGGRPVTYDRADYKGRNTIERAFNQPKTRRALATRYDKHALVYRGRLVLRAIVLWLKSL